MSKIFINNVSLTVLFQVQELFRVEYGEVFHVQAPTSRERRRFFEDLILNQAAKAPASKKKAGEKIMSMVMK